LQPAAGNVRLLDCFLNVTHNWKHLCIAKAAALLGNGPQVEQGALRAFTQLHRNAWEAVGDW
jgi:hypothetical protein